MAVLNVTPDSFSDGGLWADTATAVAHGIELHDNGADLLDVGGESTRPGADRVPAEVELGRVIPVITELAAAGVPCSIDTTRSAVAQAAVAAGAVLVNDVSGGLQDPQMAALVADLGVPWVLMHWRAPSLTMAEHAVYDDVVGEVIAELTQRVEAAVTAGVDESAVILDPGLGFAKNADHNWALLGALPRLAGLGYPVLVGASRKRFLPPSGAPPESREDLASRDLATAVLTSAVAAAGCWGVRVHEVPGNALAAEIAWRIGTAGDTALPVEGSGLAESVAGLGLAESAEQLLLAEPVDDLLLEEPP